jgi:hypothetical protein
MQNELFFFTSKHHETRLQVLIKDENVWLNRQQLAILFDRDIKTIGKHISNAKSEELYGFSVVAKFATTAQDGKVYQVEHYNLDMILSVGYRVKSTMGIEFRIWSNRILKYFLLQGHQFHHRMEQIEDKVALLANRQAELSLKLEKELLPKQGIFYDGQLFDAYLFVCNLIKSAQKSICIIDNYCDESILGLLSKRSKNVDATIITDRIETSFRNDIEKYNVQFPKIKIGVHKRIHDRFLLIDDHKVYHFGASFKDLGKKCFAFSLLQPESKELIQPILNQVQFSQ